MTKTINTSKKITDEKYKKKTEIKHSRKYEDRINLNASNIIQGIWACIDEDQNKCQGA